MFSILAIVGFMGIPSHPPPAIGYVSGVLLMLFVFTYDLTVGPVCYCLVSEIPSTRLRIKSVVLARNFYNIASVSKFPSRLFPILYQFMSSGPEFHSENGCF